MTHELLIYLQRGDKIERLNSRVYHNGVSVEGAGNTLYLALLQYLKKGTKRKVSGFSEVHVEEEVFYVKEIGETNTLYLITNNLETPASSSSETIPKEETYTLLEYTRLVLEDEDGNNLVLYIE